MNRRLPAELAQQRLFDKVKKCVNHASVGCYEKNGQLLFLVSGAWQEEVAREFRSWNIDSTDNRVWELWSGRGGSHPIRIAFMDPRENTEFRTPEIIQDMRVIFE